MGMLWLSYGINSQLPYNTLYSLLTTLYSLLDKLFFIFLLTQRHLHPVDVENRPNGLTINIFIGRQVGTGVHKSD